MIRCKMGRYITIQIYENEDCAEVIDKFIQQSMLINQ